MTATHFSFIVAPMKNIIATNLVQSIMAKEAFAAASADHIVQLAQWIIKTFQDGGKLLIFGNGGSAADAQHMAAEFVNRFLINRRPLPAIALTCDSSIITSIGNDFSFDQIFSKQIRALGKTEDLAIGITTSGNSVNVIKGLEKAADIGLMTAVLTGGTGDTPKDLSNVADLILKVPSDSTPHIQEVHIWALHLLCEMVEKEMFGETDAS